MFRKKKLQTFITAIAAIILGFSVSAQAEDIFSGWQGEFLSRDQFNKLPVMDEMYQKMADAAVEKGKDYTAQKAKEFFLSMMATDFEKIAFDKDTITFTDEDGKETTLQYKDAGIIKDDYEGYELEWHAFEAIDADASSQYKYVLLFKIHQHAEGQAHFHLRYGDKGFDDLIKNPDFKNWWPTAVYPDFDFDKELENFSPKVMARMLP